MGEISARFSRCPCFGRETRVPRRARRRDIATDSIYRDAVIYEPVRDERMRGFFCSFNPLRCLSVFLRGITPILAINAERAICHLSLESARRKGKKKKGDDDSIRRERLT